MKNDILNNESVGFLMIDSSEEVILDKKVIIVLDQLVKKLGKKLPSLFPNDQTFTAYPLINRLDHDHLNRLNIIICLDCDSYSQAFHQVKSINPSVILIKANYFATSRKNTRHTQYKLNRVREHVLIQRAYHDILEKLDGFTTCSA